MATDKIIKYRNVVIGTSGAVNDLNILYVIDSSMPGSVKGLNNIKY